ncbi:hypothetical protein D3C72_2476940 [compost metagenome]
MNGFTDRGFTLATENPGFHQLRHTLIKTVHIAHTAAQHHHVRIKNIDHVRQRFGQPQLIAANGLLRQGISLRHQRHDLMPL